ncbi:MAG TPA: GNAT family N-acetyltransferase [Streptomyces sp.]
MTIRTHHEVLTRTATTDDVDAVNLMHARSSLRSRFARYHGARHGVTHREWERLCDPARGTTLVTVPLDEPARIVAATHLMRTQVPHVRELGILVEDAWQRRGLGSALARYAVGLAHTHTLDCREITVMTGSSNRAVLSILRLLNARVTERDGSAVNVVIPVRGRGHMPLPPTAPGTW